MNSDKNHAKGAVGTVSKEIAYPVLRRFYGAVETLNAAIVELEAVGIKWDLDIVESREAPIAVQTAHVTGLAGNNFKVEIRELCSVPGFPMAFSEFVGNREAA